ncbi:DUF6493 family protein [Streptomyces avicenniae]|uniref:DUF6493 family protein n=1 Tax=Streptomyces avicenniae TaxID=500153 RepID=UPI000699E6A9|nr:DUF6493 family protein [Streptomyces avicenniae]
MTSPADAAATTSRIRDAIAAGRVGELAGLLAPLDAAGRKAAAEAARALRPSLRSFRPWDREHTHARNGLVVAAAGAFTSPAEAARWLGARELQRWHPRGLRALLTVLARRDPAWQADVAARLAERRPDRWEDQEGIVAELLVRSSGAPVPTTDGFVSAWVRSRRLLAEHGGRRALDAPEDIRAALPLAGDLRGVLRADAFLPVLLPRLFEVEELGTALRSPWGSERPEDSWTGSLATFAADGTLDRPTLLALGTSRLLRGGRPADTGFALDLLDALAPTPAEDAARAPDLLRLLSDTPSVVASHAHAALLRLDAAGLLTPEQLTEASDAVFFRTEKKLHKAHLQLLNSAAARQDAVPAVLRSLAGALALDDTLLTTRAWRLAERLLKRTGGTAPDELRDAAATLGDPELRARAAQLLGLPQEPAEAGPDEEPDPLPAHVVPPFPAPPGTTAELVEELAVLLTGRGDATAFERALAAVVHLAHRDPAALRAAAAPLTQTRAFAGWRGRGDISGSDVAAVVAAAAGDTGPRALLARAGTDAPRSHSPYGDVLAARLDEIARNVAEPGERAWPCLLATPSSGDGTLDPADLLDRLRAHEAHATEPGPADLGQALLRLTVPDDPADAERWAAAADRVGGAAAKDTARWLRDRAPVTATAVTTIRTTADKRQGWALWRASRRLQVRLAATAVPLPLDACFSRLLASAGPDHLIDEVFWPDKHALWPWVAPQHAELLATRIQAPLASLADSDEWAFGAVLPVLATCRGHAGPAVHLAVAHGLAARHAEDRTAAAEALLSLAAQGRIDPPLLGRLAAEAAHRGAVKGSRLATGLAEAADAGARAAVWGALAAALPLLLTEPPAHGSRHSGLPELLALATRCAPRDGASGDDLSRVVAEIAARGGGSRITLEAARLSKALG